MSAIRVTEILKGLGHLVWRAHRGAVTKTTTLQKDDQATKLARLLRFVAHTQK